MRKSWIYWAWIGCLSVALLFGSSAAFAGGDSGQVPKTAVWSCWYWAWVDWLDPNLYDYDEALDRYDYLTWIEGYWTDARAWEYDNHGPPQNPDDWWGHCHAWSGAAVWEPQPTKSRFLYDIEFRIRDRKGLLVETYFNCANGSNYEIYEDQPSPGSFWRYLRDEIKGVDPMHGSKRGLVGELYYGDEVWNYPIYKYKVKYTGKQVVSGTITVYAAADESPFYADSKKLYYKTFVYQFQDVILDSSKNPIDSGIWLGSGPYHRPDCIWRPYYAETYMQYVENPELDEDFLYAILY